MKAQDDVAVDALMDEFHRRLMARDMNVARRVFERIQHALANVTPSCPRAARALRRLAEATDLGWFSLVDLGKALTRCEFAILAVPDAQARVDVRLAKAFLLHLRGQHDDAITQLQQISDILAGFPELRAPGLEPSMNFLRGRSLAGKGEYDQALESLEDAAHAARTDGLEQVVGIIRITMAGVYLERGQPKKTDDMLSEAQRVVATTPDDVMARAAIHSIRAKANRRKGQLDLSLQEWDRARAEIDPPTGTSPAVPAPQYLVGRVHVGTALTTLRMFERARTSIALAKTTKRSALANALEEKARNIRTQFSTSLDKARRLYSEPYNKHGLSTVLWLEGLLAQAEDRWDHARDIAIQAYETASIGDHVARARAKQLQSRADCVAADESEPPERCHHRSAAIANARAGLEHAQRTQHARLIGRSQVYLAAAVMFDGDAHDLEEARRLLEEAKEVVPPTADDYLWGTLLGLLARFERPVTGDAWMQAKVRASKDGGRMEEIADEFKLRFVEEMMATYDLTFKEVVRLLHIGGGLRAKLQRMRAARPSSGSTGRQRLPARLP
jgi:tetratricopeptide (TPR) repeat protein